MDNVPCAATLFVFFQLLKVVLVGFSYGFGRKPCTEFSVPSGISVLAVGGD